LGDLNSRTGTRQDCILHDSVNNIIDDICYIPDTTLVRASRDKTCNNFGVKLLDLCKSTCLRIVNGRLCDDNNVGEYTYTSSQGASVIDYALTKECLFNNIHSFKIGNPNEWSDHSTVSLSLRCNISSYTNTPENETKFVWNAELRDQFRNGLIGKLTQFNNISSSTNVDSRASVNNTINLFTDAIRDAADPLFKKHIFPNVKPTFQDESIVKNKDWFDKDCRISRGRYLHALRTYNFTKNNTNREYYCQCKKSYKDLCKRKRRQSELKRISEIEKLRFSKPKQFWKYFKKSKPKPNNDVTLDEFRTYFSNLGKDDVNCKNERAETFCRDHDFNKNTSDNYGELDTPITLSELLLAVKSLKSGKAYGSDSILNEYIIESIDILGSHLCDIFNTILTTGYFPDKWTEGVIIPIHKKGDKSNPSNYRGITLVSCLSKLFTTIINKRVEDFCNKNNTVSDSQFGFRKGKSTVDAIFILQSLVQNYLNNNKRLYVIFVDLKRCFDTIYRNGLWCKLYSFGIQGKILRVIKDMYNKVKSCVKSLSSYSSYFEYAIGLRQGEVMSPLLFSLFIEDLELHLQNNIDSGLQIDDIVLILLLFADDMAILGKTPQELQNSLNLLHSYCTEWGLEVNTTKTKIMVFRKRGGLKPGESWTYNDMSIDIVDSFNYLGTVFNYTGSYSMNQEYVIGKALKALNTLWVNCVKIKMKPKILCQLFDAFVGSTLSYSSEIWGYTKSADIERIHLKFCKRLLYVRKSTSTPGVYGELGRYPLYVTRFVKIIKYWCKLINSDNIILQCVYKQALDDCKKGHKNWVTNVKKLLCDYGFAYIFEEQSVSNYNNFIAAYRQRIIDCSQQQWYGSMQTSPILDTYKIYKLNFEYERYLDTLPGTLRFYITRIRLSAHSLRIQTGRYANNRTPRNERYCLFCNMHDLEDEFHFVCVCPAYKTLREKYLKTYYYNRPSMIKYIELMKTTDKSILFNLANYLKEAFAKRCTVQMS